MSKPFIKFIKAMKFLFSSKGTLNDLLKFFSLFLLKVCWKLSEYITDVLCWYHGEALLVRHNPTR